MTDRPQKWEAKLDGHEWDLEKLPASFPDQECRVTERNGEYVLTSHELESSRNHEEANSRAEQLVSRINGAMRLCDTEYRPVRFAHVVGYTESGRPVRTISLSSTAELRFRLDLGDGSRGGGDPRVALLVKLAEKDHDLSKTFGTYRTSRLAGRDSIRCSSASRSVLVATWQICGGARARSAATSSTPRTHLSLAMMPATLSRKGRTSSPLPCRWDKRGVSCWALPGS